VTENLRDLSRVLDQAARAVGGMAGMGEPSDLVRALASARELRRELQENPDAAAESLEARAQRLARDVGDAIRSQQGQPGGGNNAANLRRLADELRLTGGGRDPAQVAENMARTRSLVEQLELELNRAVNGREEGIRTHLEEEVPEAYREVVADYYRRLGKVDAGTEAPAGEATP
jgi:hypothetical protein